MNDSHEILDKEGPTRKPNVLQIKSNLKQSISSGIDSATTESRNGFVFMSFW